MVYDDGSFESSGAGAPGGVPIGSMKQALSNTGGERAQNIKVVHALQTRRRDEVKGSRVLHSL